MEIYEYSELSKLKYNDIKMYIDKLDKIYIRNENNIRNLSKLLNNDKRNNVKKLGERLIRNYNIYVTEKNRVLKMYNFDHSFAEHTTIAGIDEVGRGPLAGPIVAAAVILKEPISDDDIILGLNDSKKLSPEKRELLEKQIIEKALSFSIALRENTEIDDKGIAVCNNEIFIDACEGLKVTPDLVLTDGYPIRDYDKVKNIHVIKGDTKSAAIAAASIIAKVYRDRLMHQYSNVYTEYAFESNVGYGSKGHIQAIKKYGVTPIHRRSFLTGILKEN
nr:ribonuclease HII [Clostridium oryzae]